MRRFIGALLVLIPLIGISPVHPAEVLGPPFLVWGDAEFEAPGDIVYNPEQDEYLVLFRRVRSSGADVYAHRVSGDGTLLSWFSVYSAAAEVNYQARAAFSPIQDEYLIVWTRFQDSGTEDDILARTVAWDGSSMGAVFPVASDVDDQLAPDVAYNENADEYLVVYHNEWDSGLRDVAAQRIKASDGSFQSWANVATGSPAGLNRHYAEVAFNTLLDTYLIAYVIDQNRVYAKVAAADLAGVGTAPEIVLYHEPLPTISWNLALSASPDDYLVAWRQDDIVLARAITAEGVPLGDAGGMMLDGGISAWSSDDVVHSCFGHWGHHLVTWDAWTATSQVDVHLAAVAPFTAEPVSPMIVIPDAGGNERSPAIACRPVGNCLIGFADNVSYSSASEYNIVARFLDVVLFSDGFEGSDTLAWSATVP